MRLNLLIVILLLCRGRRTVILSLTINCLNQLEKSIFAKVSLAAISDRFRLVVAFVMMDVFDVLGAMLSRGGRFNILTRGGLFRDNLANGQLPSLRRLLLYFEDAVKDWRFLSWLTLSRVYGS